MDIAALGYSVDSTGLVQGEKALDRTTESAKKTSAAAKNLGRDLEASNRAAKQSSGGVASALAEQENRYRSIAQRGVEYAESMRTANVSERALAESAKEGTSALNSRAAIMARAGSEAERTAERVARLQAAEERAKATTQAATRADQLRSLNLKKLQGQIDPTVAKLERLAEAERRLEKARDMGAINPQVFDQYQAKIDVTRAATLKAGQAGDVMTKSLGRMNLGAVETQQSVAALARSLATGQWGMASSSLTSLGARTGAMGGMFSAAGLAIGGATVALGAFTVMAAKGYLESRRMEGVIIGLGGAAGVTAGEMLDLRNQIGRATGDYDGADEAINRLLLSGKATGDMLESMAITAVKMARLTGQSVSTTTGEIQSLADGGAEALQKLEDKYSFLTAETWQNIEAIRTQDGELAAVTATMKEVERVSEDRTQKMRAQAGHLETAWIGVKSAVSGALQELKDYGREDVERQIVEARRAVNRAGSSRAAPGELLLAKARLDSLLEEQRVEGENERRREASRQAGLDYTESAQQSERDRDKARADASEKVDGYLAQMDQQYAKQRDINELQKTFNSLAADDPRRSDGTQEKALAAIEERYAKTEQRSRQAVQTISDEERAVERLLAGFQNQSVALERQIILHGESGRSAAMAYDIMQSGLDGVDARLATVLRGQSALLDMMDYMDEADAIIAESAKKAAGEVGNQTGEMSEYAKQAARNMQSHFADFLFDPFADGAKGMADAFSQTIRRMLAEAAATKFFEALGGAMSAYTGAGSGWVNAIGGALQGDGGYAAGGYTGHGGKHEAAGVVHKGEIVWSQEDIARAGGLRAAEALRLGWIGENSKPEVLAVPAERKLCDMLRIPGLHIPNKERGTCPA